MSELKATPGPWVASDDTVVSEDEVWVKPHDFDSWEGNRRWPSRGEQRANAHLIAAAPELYALAQTVESMIVDGGLAEDPPWSPVLTQCRAFMAKARGES